jgi:hypothetical protein
VKSVVSAGGKDTGWSAGFGVGDCVEVGDAVSVGVFVALAVGVFVALAGVFVGEVTPPAAGGESSRARSQAEAVESTAKATAHATAPRRGRTNAGSVRMFIVPDRFDVDGGPDRNPRTVSVFRPFRLEAPTMAEVEVMVASAGFIDEAAPVPASPELPGGDRIGSPAPDGSPRSAVRNFDFEPLGGFTLAATVPAW